MGETDGNDWFMSAMESAVGNQIYSDAYNISTKGHDIENTEKGVVVDNELVNYVENGIDFVIYDSYIDEVIDSFGIDFNNLYSIVR